MVSRQPAQRYYSKECERPYHCSEAATLIGIPQSPTYNNPIDNPENCLERVATLVLDRMLTNGVHHPRRARCGTG